MKLKEQAEKLKTDIPLVFLSLKDKSTPVSAKILAALTICYALSPVDLIPDFIPVLGQLDDLIILPLLITITLKMIPEEVFEKSREKAEQLFKNGVPKKPVYALPVIVFWVLLILIIIRIIYFKYFK